MTGLYLSYISKNISAMDLLGDCHSLTMGAPVYSWSEFRYLSTIRKLVLTNQNLVLWPITDSFSHLKLVTTSLWMMPAATPQMSASSKDSKSCEFDKKLCFFTKCFSSILLVLVFYPWFEVHVDMSSPWTFWLSSSTWSCLIVLGGGDFAAREELLGSQVLLAEHLDLNKDLLCRELEHYRLMNLNTLLCHVYCGS